MYLYGRNVNTNNELISVAIEQGFETGSLIREACSNLYKGTKCETCKYVRNRYNKVSPCTECNSEDKYEYSNNKAKKISEV